MCKKFTTLQLGEKRGDRKPLDISEARKIILLLLLRFCNYRTFQFTPLVNKLLAVAS